VLKGHDVVVVGGRQLRGPGVVHLAKHARRVTLLVRGDRWRRRWRLPGQGDRSTCETSRCASASRSSRPTAVGAGEHRRARSRARGRRRTLRAEICTCSSARRPTRTGWPDVVARDEHGFLLTDRDLARAEIAWPLRRPPFPFETSLPGVFAAGDVRSGSSKRLAAAVGEGAAVVT
jgi:thioredoxin reductase (NADPH)